MIRRFFVLLLLSVIVIGGSASVRTTGSANPEPCAQDHEVWLAHLMEKMETIKPGMTRWDVLKVFRAEEGLSSANANSNRITAQQICESRLSDLQN